MSEFIEILRTVPQVFQAIGMFGFVLYVGTFLAIQSGSLSGGGVLFPVVKIGASICVLVGLVGAIALTSVPIWASCICVCGLALRQLQGSINAICPLGLTRNTGSFLAS